MEYNPNKVSLQWDLTLTRCHSKGVRETYLVHDALICLDKLVVYRVIVGGKRSERVRHVVDTKEYREQAIGCCPRNIGIVDVSVQKVVVNLILKALYSGSKSRINDRILDCGPTVAKIECLDIALIIS